MRCTGLAQKVGPRFGEFEVKKLRSPACTRQKNATFLPHIHGTWESYFSPSLYTSFAFICLCLFLLLIPSGRRPPHSPFIGSKNILPPLHQRFKSMSQVMTKDITICL